MITIQSYNYYTRTFSYNNTITIQYMACGLLFILLPYRGDKKLLGAPNAMGTIPEWPPSPIIPTLMSHSHTLGVCPSPRKHFYPSVTTCHLWQKHHKYQQKLPHKVYRDRRDKKLLLQHTSYGRGELRLVWGRRGMTAKSNIDTCLGRGEELLLILPWPVEF